MLVDTKNDVISKVCQEITDYLVRVQDFSPGEYYGSFWSEKAYHGPLLDYNAGGAHHHRGCGSAALALWLIGKKNNDSKMMHRAEIAFDWLTARQHKRGGWFEIQNNERSSDWEGTGLDEVSTISTSFVVHGLGTALLNGLPPKKSYRDCLRNAGMWYLSIEWPAGSGIFPHHERSAYDTLNANLHSVESLALIATVLEQVYQTKANLFQQAAKRSLFHTLPLQWDNGCFPYRADNGVTINYTSLVLWCLFNADEVVPEVLKAAGEAYWPTQEKIAHAIDKACDFLRSCVNHDGSLKWDEYETSTAKHNIWTYFITVNVLLRTGGDANQAAAKCLLKFIGSKITASGLPPMRDRGEEITECAFMQADILLFLLPFVK
ncbi:MAG: hypothetical protein L3J71_16575 [Victivallaceae bacterium]|nr:hypothetical protein [Victivallaceae bacterium]